MLDLSVLNRKNFKGNEFIASDTAKKHGIDNSVYDATVLANLNRTADKAQEIRNLLGKTLKINSGYRCLELNRKLGSKDTSQHVKGQAIDFICPKSGVPEDIIHLLKRENVIVDQCLMEGTWIHLSIREFGKNRNQFAYYLKDENGKRKFVEL